MIRLREAGKADLPGLFELDRVCFPGEIAYSLREFRALLRSTRTISMVAEEDGDLAGFAISRSVLARGALGGHIVTIDVGPAFRRRGVGRLLMDEVESRMVRAEAAWLRLEVAIDNLGAQSFYTSLGFQPIGQIRGYYPGNLDALVMRKILPGSGTLTG
jgi:ribosomal-protein-alanine N-acetyltransferase